MSFAYIIVFAHIHDLPPIPSPSVRWICACVYLLVILGVQIKFVKYLARNRHSRNCSKISQVMRGQNELLLGQGMWNL